MYFGYQYIKILNVCVSVRVCVMEVGSSGGRTTVVTCDLRTYTLYCMCVITMKWCSSETLPHKTVGASEWGAVPDSRKPGEGSEITEDNYVCSEERTVVCHALLTRTEVRAPLISSP